VLGGGTLLDRQTFQLAGFIVLDDSSQKQCFTTISRAFSGLYTRFLDVLSGWEGNGKVI
jgi:hypothetical protein